MKWFNKSSNISVDNNKFNFNRLLQVNSRDPAINSKKSATSLINLANIVNNEQIYKFLFSNQTEIMIENKDITENLLDDVKNINNLNELMEFCSENELNLNENEINKLNANFNSNKAAIINSKLKKNLISLSKRINQIVQVSKKNYLDENIYTLYLGAYFLKAKINDTNINAPLLLYKIEVIFKNSNIFLKKLDNQPILNEKLNYMLERELKIKLDFNNEYNPKDVFNYQKYLKGFLKESNASFNSDFVNFDDKKEDDFKIYNYLCLFLVEPTGGAIKKNIEEILKKKINPFEINVKSNKLDDYENVVITNDDVIEINQKLNIYQKYAIKSALMQNTLIYGPPGTGKSEVIASIIANIIASYNHKPLSILISSEKKTALDVIYNRIGCLADLSLIISDTNQDLFFESLKKYETLIRRSLKKMNYPSCDEEYHNIVNSYTNLAELLKTKLSNNISFKGFIEMMSNIDLTNFTQYYENNYLNMIDDILNKQKMNLNQFYLFVNCFKELMNQYEDEFNILLMHKNFDFYDSDYFNKFLTKYEESSKQPFIISTFITKNKIITKKPLFGSFEKNTLDIDQNKFLKLIKDLSSLDLNKLNRDEILIIKNLNLDLEVLNQYLTYANFLNNIQKNKYIKGDTLNTLFWKYAKSRNQISKQMDDLIFNNFIYQKCLEINKLNDQQKAKIFELFGLCYLKNKPSISYVIKKYFNQIKFLFPIIFASPEQVCSLIPNEQGIFEYGIFDEASQMFFEKAFPLVFRVKTKIVAGDDKQLQPSSFFMKKNENDDEEQINTESLFEIASVCLWTKFYLKNHYRSKAAALIQFSNEHFYENCLEFSTYNGFNLPPMIVYNVNGRWIDNHNNQEIDAIINLLCNQKDLANKKILVISFNSIQSKLLKETFLKVFSKNKLWLQKYENNEINFCALEEVQGNEADVVILSVSYAKNNDDKFRQFFGPLSQKNGQNRLNVAITRAKEQMYIVKSLNGEDIKISENESNNVFKSYLTYCDQFAKNNTKQFKFIDEAINPKDLTNFEFINDQILDNIINYLREIINIDINNKRYGFIKNLIVGNKMLDIAIYDNDLNKVIFALKINNNEHFDLKTNIQFLDEIQFLTDLNYPIYTFNLIDWFLKNKIIQDEIKTILIHG